MSEKVTADSVQVRFPAQYRHWLPNMVYTMGFGEVVALRSNPACAKPIVEGPNAKAFEDFEKKVNGKK